MARADGHDIPFEEDDVRQEHFTGPVWQEWGTANDWLRAIEESGHLDPDPLANQVSDPKLIADFEFVEKTAKKRKMTEKDARRLHIVFRVRWPMYILSWFVSHIGDVVVNGRKNQKN